MTLDQHTENDTALWHQLFESEKAFIKNRMEFLATCTDKVTVIRKSLQSPVQRGTALRLLDYLKPEERQLLFDDLLDLTSVSHSDIALCREAILSLPREWVLSNIENSAESLLREGTYEEYRRLLELYIDLDRNLAQRLAARALHNDDEDIREAGEDFIELLKAG